jgi:hypothetical protein
MRLSTPAAPAPGAVGEQPGLCPERVLRVLRVVYLFVFPVRLLRTEKGADCSRAPAGTAPPFPLRAKGTSGFSANGAQSGPQRDGTTDQDGQLYLCCVISTPADEVIALFSLQCIWPGIGTNPKSLRSAVKVG